MVDCAKSFGGCVSVQQAKPACGVDTEAATGSCSSQPDAPQLKVMVVDIAGPAAVSASHDAPPREHEEEDASPAPPP
eukprot:5364760-Lingulodinium_polyedra.AAC.1